MPEFKFREGFTVFADDRAAAEREAQSLQDQITAFKRRPEWELKNMALALSLHSWSNTAEEWQRMQAACLALGRKAPRRATTVLRNFHEYLRTERLVKAGG